MTAITTSGRGERHLRAERATLRAWISVRATERGESIREATRLHNEIVRRAEQLRDSEDATWHHAVAPSTWLRTWTDDAGATHSAHATSSNIQIKLRNLDLVSGLNEELSELGATVSISWTLTEVTRAAQSREVRAMAVRDAAAKADDFAAALGRRIVSTVSLREEEPGGAVMFRGAASSAPAEPAVVSVPEITVDVGVTAEYLTS